jgi:hypothetical protein
MLREFGQEDEFMNAAPPPERFGNNPLKAAISISSKSVAGATRVVGGVSHAVADQKFVAGLDEGLLQLYCPHSCIYGESL